MTCSLRVMSEIALLLLALHRMVAAVLVDGTALALGRRCPFHLVDNCGKVGGLALDRPGQRVAAKGAEADAAHLDPLAVGQWQSLVIDQQDQPVTADCRP